MRRLVVSGYYGCGNAGDEAVLAGIRAGLTRCGGEDAELVVLSQNPEATTALHGLPAVPRMDRAVVWRTIGESDLLLSGGGSLLQDVTSQRSLWYYLWVTSVAYKLGVPYMYYAQGLGPLKRWFSRFMTRVSANRAAFITVRDEPSAQLLRAIGVHRPPIEVTADPAFALTPAPMEEVEALMRAENLPRQGPRVGVALRPWGEESVAIPRYARLLDELRSQTGAQILLLPMQVPGDVTFAEQVISQSLQPTAYPLLRHASRPDVLLGLVAQLDAVVAMRLHTLIFAAHAAVPPFALAYDPKVENLMRSLDLADSLVDSRTFEPAPVAAQVKALLQSREARSAALRSHLPDLERRALRNAECALALLSYPL